MELKLDGTTTELMLGKEEKESHLLRLTWLLLGLAITSVSIAMPPYKKTKGYIRLSRNICVLSSMIARKLESKEYPLLATEKALSTLVLSIQYNSVTLWAYQWLWEVMPSYSKRICLERLCHVLHTLELTLRQEKQLDTKKSWALVKESLNKYAK